MSAYPDDTPAASRKAFSWRRVLYALPLAFVTMTGAFAADGSASLADALGRDSETTLQFRSHYLSRIKSESADSLA